MWGHCEVYEKLMNNPQAESYKEHVMHVKVPGQVSNCHKSEMKLSDYEIGKKVCYFE